jgi:hypothetical protein
MSESLYSVFTAIVLMASCLMLYSGCAKIAAPFRTAYAVQAVGIPNCAARGVVYGLAGAEIACGVTLAGGPRVVGTALLVILASTFAVAGGLIRVRRQTVECGCFGNTGNHAKLGLRQIGILAFWFPTAIIATKLPKLSLESGIALASVAALVSTVAAVGILLCTAWRSRRLRVVLDWL